MKDPAAAVDAALASSSDPFAAGIPALTNLVNPPRSRPNILLGVPTYGPVCPGAMRGAFHNPAKTANVTVCVMSVSLLGHCFNLLWSGVLSALEAGEPVTHFAMLHADMEPAPYWLDVMLEEQERTGAQVISAVAPIKNERGLTSTGIGVPGFPWAPLTRLTMRQVMRLPETFDAADCGHPDKPLLINTGCMLIKLDPKWVYDFPGFTINDRLVRQPVKNAKGEILRYQWVPQVEPEDWNFSRWLHAKGLKAVATRKVQLLHHGAAQFPNSVDWGTQDYDADLDRAAGEGLCVRLGIAGRAGSVGDPAASAAAAAAILSV